MEFKDKLKALRNDRKLSQQALADSIHISRSAIAKWENGLGLPSSDALEALIDFFGVPADYFESGVSTIVPEASAHRGRKLWSRFCNQYTVVTGTLLILFGLFCFLTQYKFSLSMDGIQVEWIYLLPDGRYTYQLENIPDDVYCSSWKFVYTEEGCCYKIPQRSVIEPYKNQQPSQLDFRLFGDPEENNAANQELGLPHISKWYLGRPGDAILIYEEGMELPTAPDELLAEWGYLKP